MKICPKCKTIYSDEAINYCLADGSALLDHQKKEIRSRKAEIAAVLLVAIAVLVFLCLISFNPQDRSLLSTGFDATSPVKNWIGVLGANVSAILIAAFGWIAFFIPALIAVAAWRIYTLNDLKLLRFRTLAYLIFLISIAGLAYLLRPEFGGAVGGILPFLLSKLIGITGTVVVLSAILLIALLEISNFSFRWLFSHFELAASNFRIHLNEWRELRREKRLERLAAAQAAGKTIAKKNKDKGNEVPDTLLAEDIGSRQTRQISTSNTSAFDKETSQTLPDFDTQSHPAVDGLKNKRVKAKASGEFAEDGQTSSVFTGKNEPGSETITSNESSREGESEEALEEPETAEGSPAGPKDNKATASFEKKEIHSADGAFYTLPSPDLLNEPPEPFQPDATERESIARLIEQKTREFNVAGEVRDSRPGPVVTTYEFKPAPGVKYSRIIGLVDDLCLALRAQSIRIDRIPGKAYVGIEVPNSRRETIALREIVDSGPFKRSNSVLTIALGKTISGEIFVADLAKMPHLLIAGATGSGKSVGVNSLVMSILFKASPEMVKFIMVDPKRLELGLYAGIPHLAAPIITDPKQAATSLKWAVREMERRYKVLAAWGVRNIDGYNREAERRRLINETDPETGEPVKPLPFIVIIIDELADLMMVSGREVEESITRLAQMARAVGIHLVLATQRPSVDVITGLIKANFPARISYRVSSKVDSRTIIDSNGAEALLGRGDMLFLPPASAQVVRIHGAFVDEKEISRVVEFIRAQAQPDYDSNITKSDEEAVQADELPGRRDPLFWDALRYVVKMKRASTSLLQRQLRIGYGRAAALLDAMVAEGYIGEMDNSTRARPVLPKAYEDIADLEEMGGS
ncbi:MAG TPA: DNA translocase FtsK 4TM domain-containing protein [Pyrinomonadaceae bacterium]|nr:DNA translocase FtsK 4TM domain-containing protein [Pyrinomonadaceae bacterium]